jgi:ABC-type dipeptide/oligopeptide/nickel transport system permease component
VITYVLGRILLTIPVLVGAAIFIFLLFELIPGDVVSAAMGVQLLDADQQAAMREALGLDRRWPLCSSLAIPAQSAASGIDGWRRVSSDRCVG